MCGLATGMGSVVWGTQKRARGGLMEDTSL